ncbi:MAG: RsmE family RNA methyltransferase [Candidatus Dormibacteraeota bacterium]|nr:RsmE family RNA methyltransferase [Candidatus Dormibacteraeota bacterium]MDQ6790133.1 RsmE family RNA methyltransferase [Candidatus Dormibacteraeota bacterium]
MPYFFGRREGGRVEIEGADARHLARSLRARPGEQISVVEPEGRLLTVRLRSVEPGLVVGEVEAEAEHRPEPERRITLAVAMLPAPALDLVLSRCTEAGAAAFLLLAADRSVGRSARVDRWGSVCREAAMLAGRLVVPEVRGPLQFAQAWAAASSPLLLDRSGPWRPGLGDSSTLFVGPEGGWSPAELALAGERRASLGPRNLRADTAALVALTLALGGS